MRRLLYEALDALRLDPTRVYRSVYRRIPLPPPTLGGRLVHDNAPLFWTELAAVTGDADIGLHLGEAMKPRLLDVVGYLLLSARDLEEALRSFVRFQHILSGGFAARLEVEGETARLILDINYLGYASLRQQIECLMLLFLKLLALISDDEFVAERIEFRHRAPPRLGEHRRLFGRLPLFSRPHDALVFSAALLRRPSRNANPDMHDVLTRHAEEQSRELSENRLLNRVRYLIELRLGEGYGLRQCAAELGLGSGALQRALAAGERVSGRFAMRFAGSGRARCCWPVAPSARWPRLAGSPSCRRSTGPFAAGTPRPGAIQGAAGEAGRGLLDQRYLTADLQGGDGVELDLDLQEAHGALGRDVLGDALDVLVAQFQTVLLEVVDTLDQLARLVVADVAAVVGWA